MDWHHTYQLVGLYKNANKECTNTFIVKTPDTGINHSTPLHKVGRHCFLLVVLENQRLEQLQEKNVDMIFPKISH